MLTKKQSIIFLIVYGAMTLIGRWLIEVNYGISALTSIAIGFTCLMSVFLLDRFGILTLK